MKEQIEKAGKQYADLREATSWVRNRAGFVAGANFANKIWEEKTRWKSTSEDIPFNKWLIVKNADTYAAVRMAGEIDLKFIRANFTHWKEII